MISIRQRHQLRRYRLVRTIAVVLVVLGLALGVQQIVTHNMRAFVTRQPGIGGSPGPIDGPK